MFRNRADGSIAPDSAACAAFGGRPRYVHVAERSFRSGELASAALVREPGVDGSGHRFANRVSVARVGDQARAAMRLRHFSPRTEAAYVGWMRRYWEFHGRRAPAELDATHVTAFPNFLAERRRVSASTQNQALARRAR